MGGWVDVWYVIYMYIYILIIIIVCFLFIIYYFYFTLLVVFNHLKIIILKMKSRFILQA